MTVNEFPALAIAPNGDHLTIMGAGSMMNHDGRGGGSVKPRKFVCALRRTGIRRSLIPAGKLEELRCVLAQARSDYNQARIDYVN